MICGRLSGVPNTEENVSDETTQQPDSVSKRFLVIILIFFTMNRRSE